MDHKSGWRLEKNNHEDIGFAKACLYSGIITFDEFLQWIYHIIATSDEQKIPVYIWKILEVKTRYDFKPLQIMGFTPSWKKNEDEDKALAGIAYKRWENFRSDFVPRDSALQKLKENQHIEERFQYTFPFIEI